MLLSTLFFYGGGSEGGLTPDNIAAIAVGVASQLLAGGTGANTVTVQTGVSRAGVRFSKGSETKFVIASDDGSAVFALDDGEWDYAITATGYLWLTDSVTITQSVTLELMLEPEPARPVSADPLRPFIYIDTISLAEAIPLSNFEVRIKDEDAVVRVAGRIVTGWKILGKTDFNGIAQVKAFRSSELQEAGHSGEFEFICDAARSYAAKPRRFLVPDNGGDITFLDN